MVKDKVLSTILKYNLIEKNDKILIGLSGGADSVCLFYVLNELRDKYNLTIECAHVNHLIRGQEAESDAEFVSQLCNRHSLKLHLINEDVVKFAKTNGLTVEEAGRIVRYNYFIKSAGDEFKIATAHTKDDNAENILINLIKGNKPLGILPKRDNIIRPLIEVEKTEILDYLSEKEYRTDSTNFSDIYLRNKIRLSLIPFIKEKFNKNFTNTVYNVSDVLFCENEYFSEVIRGFLEKNLKIHENSLIISLNAMKNLHLALKRRLIIELYLILNKGKSELSYKNINDVIKLSDKGETGKKTQLPNSITAEISYENLIFHKNTADSKEFFYELSLNNSVDVVEINKKFTLSEKELSISYKYLYKIDSKEIIIRNKKNGDRVKIKNGHKNVSDIFTDKKIPRNVRELTPVILSKSEIIVIPGIYHIFYKESLGNIFLYIGDIRWLVTLKTYF